MSSWFLAATLRADYFFLYMREDNQSSVVGDSDVWVTEMKATGRTNNLN